MIFEFLQRERLPKSKHEIVVNGNVIATATTPKFLHGSLIFNNSEYSVQVKNIGKVVFDCDDVPVGEITAKLEVTKRVLFFKTGYDFYQLSYLNNEYHIYEVGLGANQHYYCFFKNGATVAVINKIDRVINHLDKYICYIMPDEVFIPTCLFCVFLECAAYYDIDAIGNSDKTEVFLTRQKELIEKYDPSFIQRVKDQENNIIMSNKAETMNLYNT